MIYIDVLSVFIASITAAVLAVFWFSSWLFGTFVKKEKNVATWKKPKNLIISFLMVFVIAFFLAFVEAYFNVVNFYDGLVAGAVVFGGAILPLQIVFFTWSKKSFRLFLIENGFWVLAFLIMGGVLAS